MIRQPKGAHVLTLLPSALADSERRQSERGYELLQPKVWIVVNHIIRLKGLVPQLAVGASAARVTGGVVEGDSAHALIVSARSRSQLTSARWCHRVLVYVPYA